MARGSIRWIPVGILMTLIISACSSAVLEPDMIARPTAPAMVVAQATAAKPDPNKPTPSTAAEYLRRADAAYEAGDMETAITFYTEVIRYSPRDADTHYRRGLAHHNRGDLDRAISDYDVSLQIDNGHAVIYCDRGLAYDQKGNREKAMGNFLACNMMASDPRVVARAEGYLRERGVQPK